MRPLLYLTLAVAAFAGAPAWAAPAAETPKAVYADPPADAAHPAKLAVLHIPTHGLKINGIAYLASGAGPHPTVILLHGLPGNEKNLDLAQAIRRAGWNVVTFSYRGSWGSAGDFSFGHNLEDADAVLAYVRDPANATDLGIDTGRLVIIGHSMGGWVAANTAAHDKGLIGLVTISAGDMARLGGAPAAFRKKFLAENMESLAGVTVDSLSDDIAATATHYPMPAAAPGLVNTPYLAMTSDDGLASNTAALVDAIHARGGTKVTSLHVPTDHSWSDHRIALESAVIRWLEQLGS
jgi:pimeloyl-ACP methyl ester carboxylesterase